MSRGCADIIDLFSAPFWPSQSSDAPGISPQSVDCHLNRIATKAKCSLFPIAMEGIPMRDWLNDLIPKQAAQIEWQSLPFDIKTPAFRPAFQGDLHGVATITKAGQA